MKIRVKIKTVGPVETGVKKDGGEWAARNIVLEEDRQFNPDRFLVRITGDKARNFQWHEGDTAEATIYFNVRSSEAGKQFQDIYLADISEQLTVNS